MALKLTSIETIGLILNQSIWKWIPYLICYDLLKSGMNNLTNLYRVRYILPRCRPKNFSISLCCNWPFKYLCVICTWYLLLTVLSDVFSFILFFIISSIYCCLLLKAVKDNPSGIIKTSWSLILDTRWLNPCFCYLYTPGGDLH